MLNGAAITPGLGSSDIPALLWAPRPALSQPAAWPSLELGGDADSQVPSTMEGPRLCADSRASSCLRNPRNQIPSRSRRRPEGKRRGEWRVSGCQGGRAVWGGGGGFLSSLLPAPPAAPWVPPPTQPPARGVPWFCCGGPEQGLAVLTSPCTSNARSPGLHWEQSSEECRRQVTPPPPPPPSGYALGLSSGHRCISAAELPHPGHCTWSG